MSGENVVKLADLGGAKVIKQSIMSTLSCFGTVSYMSPEMLNYDEYSFSTDIWYTANFLQFFILFIKIDFFFNVKKVAWMCSL